MIEEKKCPDHETESLERKISDENLDKVSGGAGEVLHTCPHCGAEVYYENEMRRVGRRMVCASICPKCRRCANE